MKYFTFLICFFVGINTYSQRSILDSLKREATKLSIQPPLLQRDTALVIYLSEIGRIMVDVNADSAKKYIDSCGKLTNNIKWERGKALWLHSKGTFEMEMGAYDEAGDYLFQSLKIFEKYKDDSKLAHTLLTIGINLAYAGKYKESINYHLKSIEIYKKLNEAVGVARNYTNIGNTYLLWKKYKEALSYFLKVRNLYKDLKIPFRKDRLCINAINLSICYHRLGQTDLGIEYEKEALKIAQELNGIYEQYILFEELSSCFFDQRNYSKSIDYANRSFEFANELKSYEKIATLNELLYKNYKAIGNSEKALFYHEKYKMMEDSLDRTKSREKITELELKYDTEKQENEINSLKLENIEQEQATKMYVSFGLIVFALLISLGIIWNNRILRRQNKALEAKNKEISEALLKGQTIERKRVAAELHDNIGGNIAAMRLQMLGIDRSKFSETELNTYNEVLAMIQDSYRQVRGLSHNLMPEILEKEGLVKALEKLVDKMNQNGLITFEFEGIGIENRLDPKIELEFYSICLESINNILKHSGANLAQIKLGKPTETVLVLSIMDNGKGFEKTKVEQGMGLKSIENRVNALNGKIDFESNVGKGTSLVIEVPIK